MFLELGAAVKDCVLENVPKEGPIGLLTDEATDISVTSQLITFVQFFNKAMGKTDIAFLGIQDVLEEHDAPDAKTITEKLEHLLQENNLSVDSVAAMATDGAKVMTGRNEGVVAKLRRKKTNKNLIGVHCICHILQLACNDSSDEKYISNVLETLRQLWYFMENSPKRTKAYLKIQLELKKINLVNEKGRKIVARKLKKACKTRWLSYEKSVSSLLSEFEAVLQFLHMFADSQATAAGLLKKVQNAKFVGTLYILGDVLPILSELSLTFQSGYLNFSQIDPSIEMAKLRLSNVLEDKSPLEKLERDIDSFIAMSSELTFPRNVYDQLEGLLRKYITSLLQNIEDRFAESKQTFQAFSIFDPCNVPKENEPGFLTYRDKHIATLADFLYDGKDGDCRIREEAKLKAQWMTLKFLIKDVLEDMPPEIKEAKAGQMTSTEWFINKLLTNRNAFRSYSEVLKLAEIAAVIPVSNAWLERGASSMKHIKSRLRSCLKSDLLNALMQVAVNGPPVLESLPVVEIAVKNWLGRKNRRKTKNATASSNLMATVSEPVVTEPITVDAACQINCPSIEEEVQEVASTLDLCIEKEDFDTGSDSAIESGGKDSYIDV